MTRKGTDGLLDSDQQTFLDQIGCTVHTLADGEARSLGDDAGTYTRYLDEIGADMFIYRPDFVVFGSCVAADLGELITQLQDKPHHVGLSDVAKQAVTR